MTKSGNSRQVISTGSRVVVLVSRLWCLSPGDQRCPDRESTCDFTCMHCI